VSTIQSRIYDEVENYDEHCLIKKDINGQLMESNESYENLKISYNDLLNRWPPCHIVMIWIDHPDEHRWKGKISTRYRSYDKFISVFDTSELCTPDQQSYHMEWYIGDSETECITTRNGIVVRREPKSAVFGILEYYFILQNGEPLFRKYKWNGEFVSRDTFFSHIFTLLCRTFQNSIPICDLVLIIANYYC